MSNLHIKSSFDILDRLNKYNQIHGYFILGFSTPKNIGDILSITMEAEKYPELDIPCKIIGTATREEFEECLQHKEVPGKWYYYRVVTD